MNWKVDFRGASPGDDIEDNNNEDCKSMRLSGCFIWM